MNAYPASLILVERKNRAPVALVAIRVSTAAAWRAAQLLARQAPVAVEYYSQGSPVVSSLVDLHPAAGYVWSGWPGFLRSRRFAELGRAREARQAARWRRAALEARCAEALGCG